MNFIITSSLFIGLGRFLRVAILILWGFLTKHEMEEENKNMHVIEYIRKSSI